MAIAALKVSGQKRCAPRSVKTEVCTSINKPFGAFCGQYSSTHSLVTSARQITASRYLLGFLVDSVLENYTKCSFYFCYRSLRSHWLQIATISPTHPILFVLIPQSEPTVDVVVKDRSHTTPWASPTANL